MLCGLWVEAATLNGIAHGIREVLIIEMKQVQFIEIYYTTWRPVSVVGVLILGMVLLPI